MTDKGRSSGNATGSSPYRTALLSLLLFGAGWGLFRGGTAGLGSAKEWLRSIRQRAAVEHAWPTIAVGGARIDSGGGAAALVEFADYECPYCRASLPAVDSLVTSGVAVTFYHLPLTGIHPHAAAAARAAICAEGQGRFREMHRALMTTSDWRTDTSWTKLAIAAGVSRLPEFSACLKSDGTTARLSSDVELARQLGVRGTPTFVGKTRVYGGFTSASALRALATGR